MDRPNNLFESERGRGIKMRYIIRKQEGTKYGYALVVVDEQGNETTRELNQKTTDNCLRLPQDVYNAINRHYISLKLLSTIEGDYEIEPKAAKTATGTTSKTSKSFDIAKYLNDEDRELYNKLIAKAIHAYNVEQAKAAVAAAQALVDELEAKQ